MWMSPPQNPCLRPALHGVLHVSEVLPLNHSLHLHCMSFSLPLCSHLLCTFNFFLLQQRMTVRMSCLVISAHLTKKQSPPKWWRTGLHMIRISIDYLPCVLMPSHYIGVCYSSGNDCGSPPPPPPPPPPPDMYIPAEEKTGLILVVTQ